MGDTGMTNQPHIHFHGDGRGVRQVYLNGVPVNRVLYANTSRGKIRVTDNPLRMDKYRKRILSHTLYGKVEVRQL